MKKWKIERWNTSMTSLCVTTSKAYARYVELFAMWCLENGFGDHPADVTRDQVSRYLFELWERDLGAHTRNQHLTALRRYYRWCLKESVYLVKRDPTVGMCSAKEVHLLPRVLNQEEARRLCVFHVSDHTDRTNALNRLIIEILYGSGLRVNEVTSLTTQSLCNDGTGLRFVGKGGQERLTPMSQPCIEALKVWMSYRGLQSGALLLTEKGAPIQDHHIQIMVKDRAWRARIESNVWPHRLRHSFATHLLEGGAKTLDIQYLLGHSDPSTVDVYARVSPIHLKAAYAACDPSQWRVVRDWMLTEYRQCLPSF